MGEWKKIRFGDLYAIPSRNGVSKPSRVRGAGYKMINMGELFAHDWIFDIPMELVPLTDSEKANSQVVVDDLLFARQSMVASGAGRCVIVREVNELTVFESHLIRVRLDQAKALPLFYYYYFRSGCSNIASIVQHVVQAGIRASDLSDLEVDLPDLPTQRRIAAVLGALDDKIEVNRKICENFEAQAQALFKAWFVDFEPFGGKRPEGWKMGELGSLIEVCYGKDHKKRSDGNIPVYGSGGYMRSVDVPLYDKESVLIPRKGSLNNILYVNEAFWTVDTMFYSKMRVPCVAKYVHQFLKTNDMEEMNVGSAVPSMTTDILKHLQVLIPDALSLSKFDAVADALYSSIKHANRESRALAAMRDALLPKLMSGELAVEKVEVADACATRAGQGAGEG